MSGGIAAIGAQVLCVILCPRVFTHLDKRARPHIQGLGSCCTLVASVVSAFQEPSQCGSLLCADGVQTQTLRHDRFHNIWFPGRLHISLATTWCVTLRLTPLPLYHIVEKVHAGSVWRSRQVITGIGHLVRLYIYGVVADDLTWFLTR